jgi:hypothetical protein
LADEVKIILEEAHQRDAKIRVSVPKSQNSKKKGKKSFKFSQFKSEIIIFKNFSEPPFEKVDADNRIDDWKRKYDA